MPDHRPPPVHPTWDEETANHRLKRSFAQRLWGAMIAATVLHFSIFALWPSMSVADVGLDDTMTEAIDLPPELVIPDPPDEIPHPAHPVVADVEIDPDITIGSVAWDDNPVAPLPRPRAEERTDLSRRPVFTPHTVAPRLTNRDQVERALVREYPAALRSAGIGGTVSVHVFIGESGEVRNVQIREGSGYPAFDEAALEVARVMRFSPALNRDKAVPVWIRQDIRFVVRQ